MLATGVDLKVRPKVLMELRKCISYKKAKLGESMVCHYFRLLRLVRFMVNLIWPGKNVRKHLYSLSKLYELIRTKVERNLNVS